MKFTFLGTGTSQGIPVIGCECGVCQSSDSKDNRLRTSLLVESETTTVCIDAGPDFRQQMLRENVKKLDALIFTHEHQDHTAGLDDVRAFNFLQQKPMPIFCDENTEKRLREQYSYIFNNSSYPGLPNIYFERILDKKFGIRDIHFSPIKLMHKNLPVLGFKIEDFTYITDANFIADSEKKKIKNSKVLVLNALRKERHHSHFTLDEAVQLSQEVNAEKTLLTHIGHQMGKYAEVNSELPENVKLAFDGKIIQL